MRVTVPAFAFGTHTAPVAGTTAQGSFPVSMLRTIVPRSSSFQTPPPFSSATHRYPPASAASSTTSLPIFPEASVSPDAGSIRHSL